MWVLSAAPAQPGLSTSPKCTRSNSPCRALPPHSHTLPSPFPIPTIPSRFWHCKVTQLLWPQRWISAMQAQGMLKSITKLQNYPPLELLHLNPSPAGSAVFSTRMCQWPSPHYIIWGWWGVPSAWKSAQNMLYQTPEASLSLGNPGHVQNQPPSSLSCYGCVRDQWVSSDTSGLRWQPASFFLSLSSL